LGLRRLSGLYPPKCLQALRLGKAPKEQMFWFAGSMDGRSWSPVYAVPWSVWAGARLLPDGTVCPAYRWDPEPYHRTRDGTPFGRGRDTARPRT